MATLLLIDDDPAVRQMLNLLFSDEHECHTADRAEQAIEYLESQDYDVVITDISMPGLGGIEILRLIKRRYTIPVIVISGRADRYQDIAVRIGAFAFFSKPFDLGELEKVVREAISLKKEPQACMSLQPTA